MRSVSGGSQYVTDDVTGGGCEWVAQWHLIETYTECRAHWQRASKMKEQKREQGLAAWRGKKTWKDVERNGKRVRGGSVVALLSVSESRPGKGQKSALYSTCRNCRNTSTIVLAVRSVAAWLGWVSVSVFLVSFLTFIGTQGRLDV